MAFIPETKNPGDLIRSADWNEAMQAVVDLLAKFHQTTGHQHTGAVEDAPPLGTAGLVDSAVTTAKIADNSITAGKIVDAAVTAAKIAPGVIPNIGIAVTAGLTQGMSIPVPAGFQRSECLFMVALKFVNVQQNQVANCSVDGNGVVTVSENAVAFGAAFGKKGGWV